MIRTWLGVVILMIVAMIVVGGATRLTNSGCRSPNGSRSTASSPPLNAAEWQEEFDKYRQIRNTSRSTRACRSDAFKSIFWWEWAHRLLGRLIGAVFFLPLVFFWVTGRIERKLVPPLVGSSCSAGFRARSAGGWWRAVS